MLGVPVRVLTRRLAFNCVNCRYTSDLVGCLGPPLRSGRLTRPLLAPVCFSAAFLLLSAGWAAAAVRAASLPPKLPPSSSSEAAEQCFRFLCVPRAPESDIGGSGVTGLAHALFPAAARSTVVDKQTCVSSSKQVE